MAGYHTYRADIDGLRAIAVLLVVFFHAGFSAISGGFVGVDIFFVISGYLITGIVVEEIDDGRFSFARFYARRIKRICPALFAVLGLCAVAGVLIVIPADLRVLGSSISAAVLFFSNWHFYTQVGYFDAPAIEKPLLHTWSLAIEEQFYLLWPVALYGLVKTLGRKSLRYAVLILLTASLAAAQLALQQDPALAFYLLPFRAWELLLGALIALAPLSIPSRAASNLLGLTGIAAIAYAAFAFDTKTPFPGLTAFIPCAGAALLILAGSQESALSRGLLGGSPLRRVGKISYSLYLIHWPIFSFAHIYLDRPLEHGEALAIIAASFVLAALSFRYIEAPARRAPLRLPALLWVAGPAGTVLVACGIVFHATNGLPVRAPKGVQAAFDAHDPGAAAQDRADCRQGEARPALAAHPCLIGASAHDMQYDFVIWGDSHARHMASAFTGQALDRGLSGVVLWVESCPPFLKADGLKMKCNEANAQIANWLKTQKKLQVVFLAARWSQYNGILEATLDSGFGSVAPADRGSEETHGNNGLIETVRSLNSLNIQFAIIQNIPGFPFDITYCAARARMFGRPDRRCFEFGREEIESGVERSWQLLRQLSLRYRVSLIDTAHAFCQQGVCRTEKDGVILYMDSNHVNTAGARYLGSHMTIPWPQSLSSSVDTATSESTGKAR